MKEIKITITNDGKGKDDSFEATAVFDYRLYSASPFVFDRDFEMVCFGATDQEARKNLLFLLRQFSDNLVVALNEVEV